MYFLLTSFFLLCLFWAQKSAGIVTALHKRAMEKPFGKAPHSALSSADKLVPGPELHNKVFRENFAADQGISKVWTCRKTAVKNDLVTFFHLLKGWKLSFVASCDITFLVALLFFMFSSIQKKKKKKARRYWQFISQWYLQVLKPLGHLFYVPRANYLSRNGGGCYATDSLLPSTLQSWIHGSQRCCSSAEQQQTGNRVC